MDSSGYVTLNRQVGLMREMQSVAHNISNASTTGFRREGVVFSEHIAAVEGPGARCRWPTPMCARSTSARVR